MQRRIAIIGAAMAASMLWTPVRAADIRDIDLSVADGRYTVTARTHVDAPAPAVFAVLSDFPRYGELSSTYREVRWLQEPDAAGSGRVYSLVEGCVLFVCRRLERVEAVRLDAPGHIEAIVEPEASTVPYGVSEWQVSADEAGAAWVDFRMAIEPGFWVPPIIGPLVIRGALALRSGKAAERLERLALGRADEHP